MAQAESTPITSRRTLLGAAAAVLALPTHAALPCNPDTILIGLGHELRAAWDSERAICDGRECSNDEADSAASLPMAVVQRILRERAMTLAGIQVKVTAISWCWGGVIDFDTETTDMELVQSMINDLLAIARGA
jgi:hypothetical protein